MEKSMIHVIGKNNISAKILADSISPTGKRMTTFEIEMPRIILAELNTAKMLNRNSQSSRAVSVPKAVEQVLENGFKPVYWGASKGGMVATEECSNDVMIDGVFYNRDDAWIQARDSAIRNAKAFAEAGYHKQLSGRILENFQMIRLVFGGTEFDNLFNLRIEPTAQPEFRELAKCLYNARRASTPFLINHGEYHLPYIDRNRFEDASIGYQSEGKQVSLEDAIKISLSCIAQVSYRTLNTSLDKAENIVDKLFNGDVVHGSPAEAIGTPLIPNYNNGTDIMNVPMLFSSWEPGVTHVTKDKELWSANLKGFIQYRQLIPNHVCNEFTHEKYLEYTKND